MQELASQVGRAAIAATVAWLPLAKGSSTSIAFCRGLDLVNKSCTLVNEAEADSVLSPCQSCSQT